MKKFQATNYFEWGSLKFEPLQYLEVKQSDIEDCWTVTRESDQESIIVSTKAFQNMQKIGNIIEK